MCIKYVPWKSYMDFNLFVHQIVVFFFTCTLIFNIKAVFCSLWQLFPLGSSSVASPRLGLVVFANLSYQRLSFPENISCVYLLSVHCSSPQSIFSRLLQGLWSASSPCRALVAQGTQQTGLTCQHDPEAFMGQPAFNFPVLTSLPHCYCLLGFSNFRIIQFTLGPFPVFMVVGAQMTR